jgi:predicted DNA-binding transcriptional regulator AlpA
MSGRDISHLSNKARSLCDAAEMPALRLATESVPISYRHLPLPDEQLLSLDETARLLDVSVRTLQRMARRGEGPIPLRWGRKCTRYQLGMIRSWLTDQNRRAREGMKTLDQGLDDPILQKRSKY